MGVGGMDLTINRLKEVIHYDPDTGRFTRLQSTASYPGRQLVGKEAGACSHHGYRKIVIDRRRYYAHRLAWFFIHGVWPRFQVDHVNGDPRDNRIANLREATPSQNTANRRQAPGRMRGIKKKNNRWQARIQVDRQQFYLGSFATPGEARAAYAEAAKRMHGEFARVA